MTTVLEALSNKQHILDAFADGDGEMFFSIQSAASGRVHNRILEITEAQVYDWVNGASIQDAMPQLSDEEREFLMTGITQVEWDSIFSDSEED